MRMMFLTTLLIVTLSAPAVAQSQRERFELAIGNAIDAFVTCGVFYKLAEEGSGKRL